MTQKEKQLLLKDLCSRLPYGVIVQVKDWTTLDAELKTGHIRLLQEDKIELKPYLRPISSMTEEERKELQKITNDNFYASFNYISNSNSPIDGEWHASYNCFVTNTTCNKLISWLDEKYFDHRTDEEGKTLIEKDLAIAITEKNNPYIKLNCHDIRRKIFISN